MAKKKMFEGEIVVRFKVQQTDGPAPEHLEDLHRWIEEEWDHTEVYFQGDEEKDEETVVELEVVGFEDVSGK
ncbi:hypothetical protein [Streptomyces sp. NPDC088360]|uniref:hypothetical protein n=1 Tax=Streptomyces sp. NPDC088360 TaxID=3154515 RepID=UPI00344B7C61